MKSLLIVALAVLSTQTCAAAEPETTYFVGEVKLSDPSGKPLGSQAMLASRTHDRDKNLMIERAIVVQADGTVNDYPINMTVNGDKFTIDDPNKAVEGSGTLFGPAWRWTYFKATYKAKNGAVIDDENFMAAPDVGTARKKISTPDGKVVMFMDMSLKATTRETFDILAAALLNKAGKTR